MGRSLSFRLCHWRPVEVLQVHWHFIPFSSLIFLVVFELFSCNKICWLSRSFHQLPPIRRDLIKTGENLHLQLVDNSDYFVHRSLSSHVQCLVTGNFAGRVLPSTVCNFGASKRPLTRHLQLASHRKRFMTSVHRPNTTSTLDMLVIARIKARDRRPPGFCSLHFEGPQMTRGL